MLTQKEFVKAVKRVRELKTELENLNECIKLYMVETSSKAEIIEVYDDGTELAVTYNDAYVQERLDTAEAKRIMKENGLEPPIKEVMSSKLEIKRRKQKSK